MRRDELFRRRVPVRRAITHRLFNKLNRLPPLLLRYRSHRLRSSSSISPKQNLFPASSSSPPSDARTCMFSYCCHVNKTLSTELRYYCLIATTITFSIFLFNPSNRVCNLRVTADRSRANLPDGNPHRSNDASLKLLFVSASFSSLRRRTCRYRSIHIVVIIH